MGYIIKKSPQPIILAKNENIIVGEIDNIEGNNLVDLQKAFCKILLPKATAIDGIAVLFANYNDTGIAETKKYVNIATIVYDQIDLFGLNASVHSSIIAAINNLMKDSYVNEHYDFNLVLNHNTDEVEITLTAKLLGEQWHLSFSNYTTNAMIGTTATEIDDMPETSFVALQIMSKEMDFGTAAAAPNYISNKTIKNTILAKLRSLS